MVPHGLITRASGLFPDRWYQIYGLKRLNCHHVPAANRPQSQSTSTIVPHGHVWTDWLGLSILKLPAADRERMFPLAVDCDHIVCHLRRVLNGVEGDATEGLLLVV